MIMNQKSVFKVIVSFSLLASLQLLATGSSLAESRIKACATVPELGSLLEEIGGKQVSVTVFAKGTEDPHFVLAKPSFMRQLNQADLLLLKGLELELGWLPAVVQGARNPQVLSGGKGYLDASSVIKPLEVITTPTDRSMGDVHAEGNPHYLLDPINGLRVAEAIRDRLGELRPAERDYFAARFTDFRHRLSKAMVGERLNEKYDFEKLALLNARGGLKAFLQGRSELELLGGWLGALLPHAGLKAVDEHNMWVYFAERFNLKVVGHLEPVPGYPPTTKHLKAIIEQMKADDVKLILSSSYFDPRHARFVAAQTGSKVVEMANQVQAREGTGSYLEMIDYNVKQLLQNLLKG